MRKKYAQTVLAFQITYIVPSASGSGSPQRESGTTQPMTQHHIPEEPDIAHPA